jgi:hypothetical protein
MDIRRSNSAQAEVDHPSIRTHPETGRKGLFVNSTFTIRFSGKSEEESAPLLDYLYRHLVRPEFTCRFRWSTNAIAIWDNRCVQQYAIITMISAGSCTASPSTVIALSRQAVPPRGAIQAAVAARSRNASTQLMSTTSSLSNIRTGEKGSCTKPFRTVIARPSVRGRRPPRLFTWRIVHTRDEVKRIHGTV